MSHVVLSCSPQFVESAVHEIHRHHPETNLATILAPGYLLLKTPCPFGQFTAPWKQQTPIYLHHAFPLHANVNLGKTWADLDI
ncbi:MAG: hypothetical protein K8I30_12355, partial [Anaerolineae bacterium]|nr:hypothetical protein [Anaerolineae bacterium]